MKHSSHCRLRCLLAFLLLISGLVRASDHADPMSLNVLQVQQSPEANITDLHAFVVDREGHLITDPSRIAEGDQLILNLCMRRALQPQQIGALQLKGYKFRIHLDLDPPVRFFDEKKTSDGRDFAQELAGLNATIDAKSKMVREARGVMDQVQSQAESELKAAIAARGSLVAGHQMDRSMQSLYGGIITHPDAIAENAVLEFELDLIRDGDNSESVLTNVRIDGIRGHTNVVTRAKTVEGKSVIAENPFRPGAINVHTGVYDDPFIFPRFFRRNVVAVVTSIPLASLPESVVKGPVILWATTRRDGAIDHVGRSLRTQLPRFGYLNDKHPSEHVKAITQVHDRPSVLENVLSTFLSPLIAHRHYDSVPDVMIYDLSRPAKFPNGRAFPDDVGRALADAGETLLVELSYAESKEFPRATTNDKPFSPQFPYLAPRWSRMEVAAHAQAGTTLGTFAVPRAPDSAAIAAPNLANFTWRTLWFLEVAAIILLTVLLLFLVRSHVARWALIAVAVLSVFYLQSVYAENLPSMDPRAMAQPARKLSHLLVGGGLIALLGLAVPFALGRRSCRKWPIAPEPNPGGPQGMTLEDREPPSTYQEIHKALFDPRSNRQYYTVWGGAGEKPLPIYRQTIGSIARGLLRIWRDFAMLAAARRTLRSRADLRWGADGKGFRRLLHPMGICLEGTWQVDATSPKTAYTGYFAPGKTGRVIARYSLGGNDPRNGHNRSLGMVGKLFPPSDPVDGPARRAHFVVQEDLGGARTHSITEVDLTNSPPVTLHKRGAGLLAFLVVVVALVRADKQPSERQLYQVAELEKPENVPTNCPRFMRLRVAGRPPLIEGNEADFREEILWLMYNRGEAGKARDLIFDIEVSDEGERTWLQQVKGQQWQRIGSLTFHEAVASYNGDFVVHFQHPVWREDRNDPATVARADLRA